MAESFDVGGAEQHEQEAGHERQQRCQDRGGPGVEVAGPAVGADERDELDDHDQRSGGRLGQGKAADHLPG